MLNQSKTRLQIFDDESRNYKFETIEEDSIDTSNTIISNQIFTSNGSIWIDHPKRKFKFPKLKFHHVINPIKFFKDIKSSMTQIDKQSLHSEINTLNAIMNEVKRIKQSALLQQLEKEKQRIQRELLLSHLGYKYLDEQDIVNYCKKDPKNIKIDWIKNFARVIPQDSMKLISDALALSYAEHNTVTDKEKTKLFDNIVIMHYDPKQTGTKLTEKEKMKKRDPIAFGVMQCSTRLYFITDWVDEYCDLTLQKVLKTLNIQEKQFDLEHELKKQM